MTMSVSFDIFHEIDAEHRALDREYADLRTAVRDSVDRPQVLRRRFLQLASLLRYHFAREEEAGYFDEIVELAPRLAGQIDALRDEHEQLLHRLQQFDQQIVSMSNVSADYEMFRRDFGRFLDDCLEHEARETTLVQEAYLTDIGTGD